MRNSWQKQSTDSSYSNGSFRDSSFSQIPAFIGTFQSAVRSTRLLPASAADSSGSIRPDLSLYDVIISGRLLDFALDRHGVKYLEANYPTEPFNQLRTVIFDRLISENTLFSGLCGSPNGNLIVQKIVELSTVEEQKIVLNSMKMTGLGGLCRNKYACRVVQIAVQHFSPPIVSQLMAAIPKHDLPSLIVDPCAIRVFQSIVSTLPFDLWIFFVDFLQSGDNLMSTCKDRQGCRLVQKVIDRLAENPRLPCFQTRIGLLHSIMTLVIRNCYRFSSNEFANYVVQHVIKSTGTLKMYRDIIIEKCLLRNILSMAQDKYASHVIEGAFLSAPFALLSEMMREVFEGYVRDNETNRDALDILLFHQYGNYVVQQMISVCKSALVGNEERHLNPSELRTYSEWFEKIKSRVHRHSSRLERFSSGKKIIESVLKVSPMPILPTNSLLDFTAELDAFFPSFLKNVVF